METVMVCTPTSTHPAFGQGPRLRADWDANGLA